VTAHAVEHEHPPPIHYSSRVSPAVLGMFLFIASEIMLFGSFFTVYFFDRVVNNGVNGQWPPPPFHRPVFGNRAGLQAGLLLTFLLGLTFLVTQIIEYHRIGFNTSDTSFAATFFGLTGLHGAHVFVGLTILLVMTIRAFRGHFSPEEHHGVEIGGIYWHFVDVMWIIVYVTVYLL